MSLGKKDIAKNISSKAQIPNKISHKFLKSFLYLITLKSKTHSVKISNFGTFYYHQTPKRKGRNPKTKEEFIITARKTINFTASKNLHKNVNSE